MDGEREWGFFETMEKRVVNDIDWEFSGVWT